MKKILIINLEPISECLLSTSLIKGYKSKYKDITIDVIVSEDDNCKKIFKYNPCVDSVYSINEVIDQLPFELLNSKYDIMVNLSHDNTLAKLFENNSIETYGFQYSDEDNKIYETLYKFNKSNKNMFQLYFSLCGLIWRGEGYDIYYHPKTKSKQDIGVIIVNKNLNNYLHTQLKFDKKDLNIIPFKNNIFKKMDEINKYQKIITDDFLSVNISCLLRKEIFFLKTVPYNYQLEFFGKGNIIEVPKTFIK